MTDYDCPLQQIAKASINLWQSLAARHSVFTYSVQSSIEGIEPNLWIDQDRQIIADFGGPHLHNAYLAYAGRIRIGRFHVYGVKRKVCHGTYS